MRLIFFSRHFVNALDCVKHTYSQEGYRGFWSGQQIPEDITLPCLTFEIGSITPLFNLTCSRLVTFSVYQKTKYALNDVIEKRTGQSPLIDVNVPGTYPTLATCTCFGLAGMAAGLGNSLVSCMIYDFDVFHQADAYLRSVRSRQECRPDIGAHVRFSFQDLRAIYRQHCVAEECGQSQCSRSDQTDREEARCDGSVRRLPTARCSRCIWDGSLFLRLRGHQAISEVSSRGRQVKYHDCDWRCRCDLRNDFMASGK